MSESNPLKDALNKESAAKPELQQPAFLQSKVETKVVKQPKVEIVEVSLEDKLIEAQNYLNTLITKQTELDKEIKSTQIIVNKLAEEVEKANPKQTSQEAILEYLRHSQKRGEERAGRIKLISESGLNLKELATNLKSPLDTALSRKKKA